MIGTIKDGNNLLGENHLIILEGDDLDLLGNTNLDTYLRDQIKKRKLKVSPAKYAQMLKTISSEYEKTMVKNAQTNLKGYIEESNGLNGLLGSEGIEELNGEMEREELLGYIAVMDKPKSVLELLGYDWNEDLVSQYREVLRGVLVDETETLSGDDFDSMDNAELLGFLKKFFKGVGKFVKGVGKGIGKVAKGVGKVVGKVAKGVVKGVGNVAKVVGKGIGQVGKGVFNVVKGVVKGVGTGLKEIGKFVGKNWQNLIKLPLALIPGGGLLLTLADTLLNQEQQNQEQQPQQEPIYQEQTYQEPIYQEQTYQEPIQEFYPEEVYTDEEFYPEEVYTDEEFYPEEVYTDEYFPEEVYTDENSLFQSELLGASFLEKLGKFGSSAVNTLKNYISGNPEIQFQLMKLNPQQQYAYALKLMQSAKANIDKQIIDEQAGVLYTTQKVKQQATNFGSEIFSQIGIPLVIVLGFLLMSSSNNNNKA